MKRKLLSILLIISILGLSSCSLAGDILNKVLNPDSSDSSHTSGNTEDTEDTEATAEQTDETTKESTKETTETVKYKYELKSDMTELLANGTTNLVTFTVSVSEEVQSITLTENNSKAEYIMLDDGAYSEGYGGDDIAKDGTYTASVTMDISQKTTFNYSASVVTGSASETTNPITIEVVAPVDAGAVDEMNTVYQDSTLLANAEIIKSSSDAAEITKAKEDIVAYFKGLESDGVISNLEGNADSESLSFKFSNGIKGGFILEYSPDSFSAGSTAADQLEVSSEDPSLVEYQVDEDNIVGNNKALFLSSFDVSKADFTGSYVDAYNKLDTSAIYDFAPVMVYNASVVNYQYDLDDYGMIFINSHGTFYAGDPIICLDEVVTVDNILLYSLDLLAGRLVTLGSISAGTATYAITPAFIEYYYGGGALDNSLVYMCICKGYMNSNLVDAFENSGAGAVTAFSDTVLVSYDKSILGEYLNNLMAGKTVKESQDAAIAVSGPDDGDATPAVFKMTGNEDLTIMQMGILNGSFEEEMTGWSGTGDSRVIGWLTDLSPTDQANMAIISTGLGSAEASYGTEGSSLQQTFIVPANAKLLTFDYDVVSEEPMEYVASSYDDYFDASIIDMTGAPMQLVYENVNNSAWVELGGDYFSGGDDTTYDTTWISKSIDVSAYAGQCITLTFHTGDVGDSAYDTAGLLDNIKLYVTP